MKNLTLHSKDSYQCYTALKTPVGKYQQLKIEVDYYIGGMNYFSGNHNPRAYRLSFKPCNRGSNGFTESTLLGVNQKEQGYYLLIEKTNRFNAKRLAILAACIDSFVDALSDAYIQDNHEKMREIISKCEPRIAEEKQIELSKINACGKTRPVNDPYETWIGVPLKALDWEWRILKKYQSPAAEAKNPYARWFCAVYSPITREQCSDGYELGDVYIKDITSVAVKKG